MDTKKRELSLEEESRNIPSEIRREVRRRCGFGCVVCGYPLWEYHHMIPYAEVKEHKAENLTLLCGTHHDEVGSSLPDSIVSKFNKNPHNLGTRRSKLRPFYYDGTSCKVEIGSWSYVFNGINENTLLRPFIIDSVNIVAFRFEDNQLLLSLEIYDKNNNLMIHMVDSEMRYSVNYWDIEVKKSEIIIREASRKILLNIRLEAKYNRVVIDRGEIYLNGIGLRIFKNKVVLLNGSCTFSDLHSEGSEIGYSFGHNLKVLENMGVTAINIPVPVDERLYVDKCVLPSWFYQYKPSFIDE